MMTMSYVDELEALVLTGKEELKKEKKSYSELWTLYSNLKTAVAT